MKQSTPDVTSDRRMLALLLPWVILATPAAPTCPTCSSMGRVVPASAMTTARAAQSAVRLVDGRVLMVGGCVRDGCVAGPQSRSTEFYDPRTGRFTAGPDLVKPRSGGQVVVRLEDDRVLVAAGWSGEGYLADAEVYDPETDRFESTGSLLVPRQSPTATVLRDGRVLVAGGSAGGRDLTDAELYDPRAGRFTSTGALHTARSAHAATLLQDGNVLITGGESSRGHVLASVEIYDPAAGAFHETGAMTEPRYKHAAVSLADGRVLVAGGSGPGDAWHSKLASAEIYDPATDRFTATGAMHYPRFKIRFATVLLPDGRVLIAGGAPQTEMFNAASGRFTLVDGALDASRQFSTATLLQNGEVLIAGGYDDHLDLTAQAWRYAVAR